jgi:hypothetical protein
MASSFRPPVLSQSTVDIDLSDLDCTTSPTLEPQKNKENLASSLMHKQNGKARVHVVPRQNSRELAAVD